MILPKSIKVFSLLTTAIFAGIFSAKSQSSTDQPVTTAVPFLRISPDARAGGMGDAGIATSADANSGFFNLAKTPFAKETDAIGLTYTPWLKDIANDVFLATIAGYHKIDEDQAISGGIRYFSLGDIQFVNDLGFPTGTGRPREFALDVGYSRKVADHVGVGVALRYINSALANGAVTNGVTYKAGNTVAADLSVHGNNTDDAGQGLSWGLALSNLGGKVGYTNNAQAKDYIPANMGAGIAYTWVFQEINKFTLTGDVNKLLVPTPPSDSAGLVDYRTQSVFSSWFKSFSNNAYAFSFGAEFTYNDQFTARAGYYSDTRSLGKRSYFTAGVGVKYQILGINFSYLAPSGSGVTRNPLSNTLRFSLLFNLESGAGSQ